MTCVLPAVRHCATPYICDRHGVPFHSLLPANNSCFLCMKTQAWDIWLWTFLPVSPSTPLIAPTLPPPQPLLPLYYNFRLGTALLSITCVRSLYLWHLFPHGTWHTFSLTFVPHHPSCTVNHLPLISGRKQRAYTGLRRRARRLEERHCSALGAAYC